MTNEMIILSQRVSLMEQGVIGTTGRTYEVELEDGTKKVLEEPEEIHTFAAWKSLGFSVKKGEHAVAAFPVWKYKAGKAETEAEGEETPKGRMYLRKAFFFTAAQVQAI